MELVGSVQTGSRPMLASHGWSPDDHDDGDGDDGGGGDDHDDQHLPTADHLPEGDDGHVVSEAKGGRPMEGWLHVHDRLHFVPVGGENVPELGQKLVAGDDQLCSSLIQPVHLGVIGQVLPRH